MEDVTGGGPAASGESSGPSEPEPEFVEAVDDGDREMWEEGDEPGETGEDLTGERMLESARTRRGILRFLPRPVRQIGRLLILALLIEYLIFPQLAGPRKVISLINQVHPLLLLAGVGLEIAALLSYAKLTQAVLPSTSRVGFFTIFRIQMSTLSVSHCAPGGSATGTALGYRLLTQRGVKATDAGFVLGVQGVGSAIVLNLILWISLIVSIPVWGFDPIYLLAALVGAVLLSLSAAIVFILTRGNNRAGLLLERAASRVPYFDAAALRRAFDSLAERMSVLTSRRDVLARALAWATANWLLDAASLEVFVRAFGHWVNPDGLLVAYGLANVLAVIPLTPGGLGVVEAAITTLLVGFDIPRGVATLGVIVWRLINFWAPIPMGGLAYLSLQGGAAVRARQAARAANPVSRSTIPVARAGGAPAGDSPPGL